MSTTTSATEPTRRAFNPDVKKFTGFLAIDGSTHTSSKAALEHSREIKIKNALLELAQKSFDLAEASGSDLPAGFYEIDDGNTVILDSAGLADYLYANREAVLAALNVAVTMRKPRSPNKKAATTATA